MRNVDAAPNKKIRSTPTPTVPKRLLDQHERAQGGRQNPSTQRKNPAARFAASPIVRRARENPSQIIDHLVCHTVQRYGLHVAVNFVDAHSSNWSALFSDSTHSARNILPRWLMENFSDVNFSIKHIRVDPVTDQPVVNSPDPCHLTKKVVLTLEKSWLKIHKRYLMYHVCPAHLGMI